MQAERQRSRNALALPDAPWCSDTASTVSVCFHPKITVQRESSPFIPKQRSFAGASLVPIPEDAAAAAIIVVLARVGRAAALQQDGP